MNLISTLSKTIHCFLIKIVHCFLHKLFPAFCIKLFSVQHYLKKNHSIFYVNYFLFTIQKIVHCFLIKHLVKSCFLNLKAKSKCFFMFEFYNNRIYFSALIKFVSILIKFALYTSYLLYIQICLLHS